MTRRTTDWAQHVDDILLNDAVLDDAVLNAKMTRSIERPTAETRRDAYHAVHTPKKGRGRSLQLETMEARLAMSGLTDAQWQQPASMPQGALGQLEVHAASSKQHLYDLDLAPNEETMAIVGQDKLLQVINTQHGSHVNAYAGHTHYTYSVAYSPDGKTIATASYDKTVKLWDAQSGQLLDSITSSRTKLNT